MYAYLKNTQVVCVSELITDCIEAMKSEHQRVFNNVAKKHELNYAEPEDLMAAYNVIKEDGLVQASSYVTELEGFDADDEDWEMETEEGDTISYFEIMMLL